MAKIRPPYLPETWDNDAEMKGLMSLPKAKHVNPINYKRVIDFWKDIISDYCKHEKTCLFTLDELKHKFRRGSQLPSPLSLVIQEMQDSNLIQTHAEFSRRNQGWMEWGISLLQPTSWFGAIAASPSKPNEKFVDLAALKHLANSLLMFYRDEYELVDCPEVVDYYELKASVTHIIRPECFDLVITELIERGEVSMGQSKSGDKVLKFKDQSTKGPARFTDTDASVHDLRKTMLRVEAEIKKSEERMLKLQDDARQLYRKGDKKAALNLMKKKKRVEEEIATKDKQYQNLLQMLQQLAQSKQTKEIVDIYRESSTAFKAALKRQGLTPENVDMTLDDVNEAMRDIHDVEDALRDGFRNLPSAHESLDEAELESELNELLAESGEGPLATADGVGAAALTAAVVPASESMESTNKVRVGKRVLDLADLPDVPSGGVFNTALNESAKKSVVGAKNGGGDSLEARWKRLRAE